MSLFKKKNSSADKQQNKGKFSKLKYSVLFLLFEIVFTGCTLVLIIFYGPFINVKKSVVGSLINTGRHQYMVKWFLSDSEINELTNYSAAKNGSTTTSQKTDVNEIKVEHKNDTGIDLENVSSGKFKGYALIIHDPTRVKVAYTKYLGKQGQITSEMAEDNGAIAAINGGDFQDEASTGAQKYTGTGGKPIGILIANGKVISNLNGKTDAKLPAFGITDDGKMLVGSYSVNDFQANNVNNAISAEQILVLNGVPQAIDQNAGIAPRTAIGQMKDGSIIFLAIDGRSISSAGASYEDVRNLLVKLGAVNAVALDGGSSTTMYYNGSVINNPSDAVGERYVPSIVYAK